MKSIYQKPKNRIYLNDRTNVFRSANPNIMGHKIMGKEVNKYVYHYKVRFNDENGVEQEKRFLTAKDIQKEFNIGKTTLYNYKKGKYKEHRGNPSILEVIKLDPPEKVNITVLFFD